MLLYRPYADEMAADGPGAPPSRSVQIRISSEHRDALARVASGEDVATLDEALGKVLFVYESLKAVERLSGEELESWRAEALEWVETDTEVIEP